MNEQKLLLTKYRNELEILAKQLLEKEVLLKSDVERLIGARPFETAPLHHPSLAIYA